MSENIVEIGNAPHLTAMIPNIGAKYFHSAWESPESFAAYMASLKRNEAWDDSGWEDDRHGGFYGGKSFKEAVAMAVDGWPEGTDKIAAVRDKILTLNPTLIKPINYGIAGAYPNVPRAIAGNIMNMRVPDISKSRRRPVFTLMVSMGATGSVEAEAITNRAAVVAAMIDQIEAKGFACEVVTCSLANGMSGFKAAVSIVVKKSSQAVDIVRLAFALGHASFFRRLVFASRGHSQHCKQHLGWGLGSTCAIDTEGLKEKDIYVIPGINECEAFFMTDDLAASSGLKFLSDALAKQGCPAFPKWKEEQKEAA